MNKETNKIQVYIDETEQKIYDPSISELSNNWKGSNNITFKLFICLEAIRDIYKLIESNSNTNNQINKRIIKILATPLFTLANGIYDMYNYINSNSKENNSISKDELININKKFNEFLDNIKFDKDSELKKIRDKISAHLDKDAIMALEKYWSNLNQSEYLKYIMICIKNIVFLLKFNIYGWTQDNSNENLESVKLMANDGIAVDLIFKDGKPQIISKVAILKSPKYAVENELLKVYYKCNKMSSFT